MRFGGQGTEQMKTRQVNPDCSRAHFCEHFRGDLRGSLAAYSNVLLKPQKLPLLQYDLDAHGVLRALLVGRNSSCGHRACGVLVLEPEKIALLMVVVLLLLMLPLLIPHR